MVQVWTTLLRSQDGSIALPDPVFTKHVNNPFRIQAHSIVRISCFIVLGRLVFQFVFFVNQQI